MTQTPQTSAAVVPAAIDGVTVIPKTAAQQRRSAIYNWIISIAIGTPGVLMIIGQLSGQLAVLFPKYGPTIIAVCSLCAALGHALRANQLGNSAKCAMQVDFSGKPK